jgi:hypothetical protein
MERIGPSRAIALITGNPNQVCLAAARHTRSAVREYGVQRSALRHRIIVWMAHDTTDFTCVFTHAKTADSSFASKTPLWQLRSPFPARYSNAKPVLLLSFILLPRFKIIPPSSRIPAAFQPKSRQTVGTGRVQRRNLPCPVIYGFALRFVSLLQVSRRHLHLQIPSRLYSMVPPWHEHPRKTDV